MLNVSLIGFLAAVGSPEPAEKQVVGETTHGALILGVFPKLAPVYVAKCLEWIRSEFYLGTTFHAAVPMTIVQGGDPLTWDSANCSRYRVGGLKELKQKFNDLPPLRGTLSTSRVPEDPNWAGSQFFFCRSPQPHLDGKFTGFGRIVVGFEVLGKVSKVSTDGEKRLIERVEITATWERDRPAPPRNAFC